MSHKLAWIQLTDLHFGNTHEKIQSQNDLLDNICDSIVKARDRCGINPELLFITGDLVSTFDLLSDTVNPIRPRAVQLFQDVVEQVQYFTDKLSRLDINIARTFSCPGNHDVIRSMADPQLESVLHNLIYSKKSDEQIKIYSSQIRPIFDDSSFQHVLNNWMSHLDVYHEIVSNAGFVGSIMRPDLSHADVYQTTTGSYNIICLNSAWACTDETSRMPAIPTCADLQLDFLLKKLPKNDSFAGTIVLCHHPIGWMWPQERWNVRERLQRHADFYLRGHEHVEWINPSQSSFVEVGVGSTSEDGSGSPQNYSLAEFDSFTNKSRIIILEQNPSGHFAPKENKAFTTADGAWIASHTGPEDKQYAGLNSRATVRRLGAGIGSELSSLGEFIGPVVSVDIARFSALDAQNKLCAVRCLWAAVSAALESRDHNTDRVILSPTMDGMHFAFISDNVQDRTGSKTTCLEAIAYVDSIVEGLSNSASEYYYRYGIAYGSFDIHANNDRSVCHPVGIASSVARRLSLSVDSGTIGICSSVFEQLELEHGIVPKILGKRIEDSDDDPRNYLWLPITVRTTPAILYATVTVKEEQKEAKGKLAKNAARRLQLLKKCLKKTGDWPLETISSIKEWDLVIVVHSEWSGTSGISEITPVCAVDIATNSLHMCADTCEELRMMHRQFSPKQLSMDARNYGCTHRIDPTKLMGLQDRRVEIVSTPLSEAGSGGVVGCLTVWARASCFSNIAACVTQSDRYIKRFFDNTQSSVVVVNSVISHERSVI